MAEKFFNRILDNIHMIFDSIRFSKESESNFIMNMLISTGNILISQLGITWRLKRIKVYIIMVDIKLIS